jgi:hypothetical protein
MRKPSQAEINRVKRENRRIFRLAGVNINKAGPLTEKEVARLNSAMKMLRAKKRKK